MPSNIINLTITNNEMSLGFTFLSLLSTYYITRSSLANYNSNGIYFSNINITSNLQDNSCYYIYLIIN